MTLCLALLTGLLFGVGVYMLKRRSLPKLVVGLALLGHATNLLIFVGAGIKAGPSPIIPTGQERILSPADPLPQALILTAIVISFGVLAFLIALVYRVYRATGTDDVQQLNCSEPLP